MTPPDDLHTATLAAALLMAMTHRDKEEGTAVAEHLVGHGRPGIIDAAHNMLQWGAQVVHDGGLGYIRPTRPDGRADDPAAAASINAMAAAIDGRWREAGEHFALALDHGDGDDRTEIRHLKAILAMGAITIRCFEDQGAQFHAEIL